MDGIPNLLRAGIESELKDKTFRNLLLSCADQRAFTKCSTGISSFIGLINGKLNEPSSRNDGLLLLQTFLPQCSLDVLTQNGSLWIQLCLKGAAARHTAQLSFNVLKMLLNLSESVPELSRHVSSVAVANFAEIIHNGISPQAYIDALDCLELCMKKYNGPCGPHKKVIHSFLLSLLDYSGPNQLQVVWHAARCVALVPQVGGGGTGGVQYKLAWALQQKQLCRTIHLILDDLYSDTNELQVSLMGGMLEGTEPLSLPEIDDSNPVLRTQNLVNRLCAVSACLQAMLVMAYPVAKNVSLSSIMNLICRGLAVNGSSIGPSNTTHTLALTAVLPKVHQSLLKLLEALIVLARANLLPFAASICRLSMQTLKWTRVENWPYGTERPYKLLRIQAYENLRIWCGIVKGGSGIEDTAHQFIDVALHDIFSEKDTVSLSAGLLKKSNNQRKAKGHKGAASLAAAAMAKDGLVVNEVANKDVCVAALKAATAILMAASSRMQASVHQALQETVVAVLLKVSFKAGESPIPYSNPSARLELYRLLLQLVLNGHTVWPTPINMALKFFSSGLHDPDVEISMFCGIAQSTLEKIIHPAYPSLYITPSQKEVDACIETSAEAVMSELPIIRVEDHSGEADHDPNEAGTPSKSCPQRSFAVPRSVDSSPLLSNGSLSKLSYNLRSLSMSTPSLIKPEKNSLDSAQDTSMNNAHVGDKSLQNVKSSLKMEEKAMDDDTGKEDIQKAIDLTNSDVSDDEISEVPCEIDLAESEEEKGHSDGEKSISSQTTVHKEADEDLGLRDQAVAKESKVSIGSPLSLPNGKPLTNGTCESGNRDETKEDANRGVEDVKRAVEDENVEGSASKKAKFDDDNDDDAEFPSDEDSMLLSFVDVTRDEENEDN